MLFNILGLLSFITDLLPLVLLVVFWRVTKFPVFMVLFAWTIFSIISDILISIYDDKGDQIIAYISIIFELLFISILYFYISKRPKFRFVYLFSGTTFVMIGLVKLLQKPPDGFDYLLASLCLLNVLVMSLMLLYEKFVLTHGNFLLNDPEVWFILAYIIYCSGNLFLFATTDRFPDVFKAENTEDPWSIFLMANIIKNMLFCKAIMLAKKKLYPALKSAKTGVKQREMKIRLKQPA